MQKQPYVESELLVCSDDALHHILYTLLPAFQGKTTLVTENPEKARLTTLIQNFVIFTRLGARMDNEVLHGTKRYKYTFFENTAIGQRLT